MLTEEIRKTALELNALCRDRISEIWRNRGFIPSSHQFLFSRDPAFTLARRCRVYRTTPHLRWELILSFLIHSCIGNRVSKSGRARILSRTSRFSGDACAFYFNGLILDLLESFRNNGDTSDWESLWEKEALREFETDTLQYPQRNGLVQAWGYFPVRHHRFHPRNLVFRLMHRWGAIAADLDSTSMVLSRLIKSGSETVPPETALVLLEEHMQGTGKYGGNPLAYDNGVGAEDRGVLLWVHEKHNELDAGVNVNVLCLLAALMERMDESGRERITRISVPVFAFLARHIGLGSYSEGHFLMFYSLEAFVFLWHRLAVCLEAMPSGLRVAFDPEDVSGRLGRHLCVLIEKDLGEDGADYNSFDRLMILPTLLRHRSVSATAMLSPQSLRTMVDDVSSHPYEFGKFVYPFTFLYGNQALGLSAAMCLFREIADIDD